MNDKTLEKYYMNMFKDYPDVVKVDKLLEMLPKIGRNKIYSLLRNKEIFSKRIGRDYYIPKISIIRYLMEK